MNHYRPISLLSIFDTIIEKITHKRLYSFLEDNNILYKKQFGFRKNNSAIDLLIKITEKIRESIEENMAVVSLLNYVNPWTELTTIFCYSKWNIMEVEAQLSNGSSLIYRLENNKSILMENAPN